MYTRYLHVEVHRLPAEVLVSFSLTGVTALIVTLRVQLALGLERKCV